MQFKLAICAILSVMLAPIPVEAASRQTSGTTHNEKAAVPQLSPEELREALAIADSFTKGFRESRDMDPIIRKLFARGFERFLAGDGSWAGLIGLSFPLVEHLNRAERLRCYSTQFSIEYIIRLYLAGKVSLDSLSKGRSASVFPPDVIKFLDANQPPEREVKSSKEARQTMAIFERALPFLRDHLVGSPPEETDQFKRNLAAFEKHLDEPDSNLGRPVLRIPNQEVAGYPMGTRLIAMEVPFHVGLLLVREDGELKVLFAMTRIPPD